MDDFSFDWPPTINQYYIAADWVIKNSNCSVGREGIAEAFAVICTLSSSAGSPVLITNIFSDYSLEVLFIPSLSNMALPNLPGLELSSSAIDAIGKAFSLNFLKSGNDTFLLEEHGMSLYIFMKHVRHTILQATGVELIN
ncbi:hypothetical protein HQN60_15685 (plasmid) [Deefgea piscis]|uniref:Uncharacterized protein n=1 Tax=Deefgea piscis TaxID=2739061 RepID=A0A6M8SSE6_9NEIS|nr:hypothetical protein [Deefgea piscis]QKJ68253.1 hypothetical protein HQN60_15685 [Deefgea piscis]